MYAESTVVTEKASLYIKQLCRHFAHKITVEYDDQLGMAYFPMGTCSMTATPTELKFRAEAETEDALAKVQSIINDHLERFAFRENIKVAWEVAVAW